MPFCRTLTQTYSLWIQQSTDDLSDFTHSDNVSSSSSSLSEPMYWLICQWNPSYFFFKAVEQLNILKRIGLILSKINTSV